MNKPIVGVEGSGAQGAHSAWSLLMVLGVALAIVGLTDIALLWYPARWASVDWEFGTVSAAFDALPLATIGLGLASSSAVARSRRGALIVLALVQGLMLLVLIALLLVFVLDVPVVLRAVDPQLKLPLTKALMKTGSMAVVYIALYLTLGLWTARRIGASRKGAGV